MKIKSTAFSEGEKIPARYTCDGEGTNPDLELLEVPVQAESLVLVVDDPDAPMGNFNHWVVWNIPPDTLRIDERILPVGSMAGINDNEVSGWAPPCPPGGTHRYYFKIYALDFLLNLPATSRKADVEKAMVGHILGEAELMGKYSRI